MADECCKKHLVENEQAPDKFGAGCKQEPYNDIGSHEHDKIMSRTRGKMMEIGMGPNGGGLVPANPFASLAQAGYMHANPEILGKKGLLEWDESSKGRKIPKHVKK